jgi:hypothetical protein
MCSASIQLPAHQRAAGVSGLGREAPSAVIVSEEDSDGHPGSGARVAGWVVSSGKTRGRLKSLTVHAPSSCSSALAGFVCPVPPCPPSCVLPQRYSLLAQALAATG